MTNPYQIAQCALANLKSAIHIILVESTNEGVRNVDIGRCLGINYGHSGKHQDHIPRILLEIMEKEGVVYQDKKSKKWFIKSNLITHK